MKKKKAENQTPLPEEKEQAPLLPGEEDLPEAAEGEEEMTAEEAAEDSRRMREDIALFRRVFPDVTSQEIPQEVWERVEQGESLAASFALYTVQKEKEEARIRKVNAENEASAPPRIRHDGLDGDFFTPEMVKKMTPGEVRKNYKQILKSMDQWN